MALTAAKARFETSDSALGALVKAHRDLFEEYEQLVTHRNEALDAYKSEVARNAKKLGPSFGVWKISVPRALDADALTEALGGRKAEPYLKVKVSVDSAAYDVAVANGDIPDEVQEVVEGEGNPRLTGPKPVGIYIR
jgi:hypothetical protein